MLPDMRILFLRKRHSVQAGAGSASYGMPFLWPVTTKNASSPLQTLFENNLCLGLPCNSAHDLAPWWLLPQLTILLTCCFPRHIPLCIRQRCFVLI